MGTRLFCIVHVRLLSLSWYDSFFFLFNIGHLCFFFQTLITQYTYNSECHVIWYFDQPYTMI